MLERADAADVIHDSGELGGWRHTTSSDEIQQQHLQLHALHFVKRPVLLCRHENARRLNAGVTPAAGNCCTLASIPGTHIQS